MRRKSDQTDAASNQAAVKRCEFVQSDQRGCFQSGCPELWIGGFNNVLSIWIRACHLAGDECDDDVIAVDSPDDEGWADLQFPPDPLAEDPQYVLTIVDSEKFADGVEKLFPEVDWDEPVSAAVMQAVGGAQNAAGRGKAKTKRKK